MAPKQEVAPRKKEGPSKYVIKAVRATLAGWDGIRVRQEGDTFAMRIWTHGVDEDGQEYAIDPPRWVEVLGDAPESAVEKLKEVLKDPTILLPNQHVQNPPSSAKLQGAPQADTGVL